MSKRKYRYIYILAALTVLLVIVIYALPKVSESMTKTVIAEYGSIEETDSVTCYFVRNEKVYAPSVSGSVKLLIDEGTKIRKNTKIAEISQGEAGDSGYGPLADKLGDTLKTTSDCKSKINGQVSYMVDGNEAVMSVSNLKNISFDDVKNMDNDFTDLKRETTAAGEPLYKIYKNEKWYMLFWTDEETAAGYEKGNTVTVRFEDAKVSATVSGVRNQGSLYRVCLVCNRYYEHLADTRRADASIVTSSASGLIVPLSCITKQDDAEGVMVRNTSGEFEFMPVNVLMKDKENAVVSSDKYYDSEGNEVLTIKIYDEMLRNP